MCYSLEMREGSWYEESYKLCLDLAVRKNYGSCPAHTSSFLFCEKQIVGRWEGRRRDSWCMPVFCPSRELVCENMQLESGKFSPHPSARYSEVPTVTKEMAFFIGIQKYFHFFHSFG